MAWRCSGTLNAELISNLFGKHKVLSRFCSHVLEARLIKSERVRDAMTKVDRAHYSPRNPYHDRPQPIGYNATISAPHMHAHALEALDQYLYPGANVLDVGSGSGYLCACMAAMVSGKGKVTGIEHVEELAAISRDNLLKDQAGQCVEIVCADGRGGYEPNAPYDCIHVGAAHDGYPQHV
jgi:protein-L-isoaspartate(D-aspartate) O-methyltransferase